jgi:tetratricopeptide (TPR) repeat protein
MKDFLPDKMIVKLKSRIVALSQFPNIPLTIPEWLEKLPAGSLARFLTSRMFLFNFMVGFLVMGLIIVAADIRLNRATLETVDLQRQIVAGKIDSWKEVVDRYPGYRDGYYQLALLENQMGNKQMAYDYTVKAIQADPDFRVGKELLQTITR